MGRLGEDMTAAQSRRGRDREGAVVRNLTLGGWVAIRAASGPVDVVAVGHNVTFFPGIGEGRWAAPRPLLIQVKSTSRPYERFGPEDRDVLRELSWKAGCEAWLVHWPAGGRCTWVHETDWPPAGPAGSRRGMGKPTLNPKNIRPSG